MGEPAQEEETEVPVVGTGGEDEELEWSEEGEDSLFCAAPHDTKKLFLAALSLCLAGKTRISLRHMR